MSNNFSHKSLTPTLMLFPVNLELPLSLHSQFLQASPIYTPALHFPLYSLSSVMVQQPVSSPLWQFWPLPVPLLALLSLIDGLLFLTFYVSKVLFRTSPGIQLRMLKVELTCVWEAKPGEHMICPQLLSDLRWSLSPPRDGRCQAESSAQGQEGWHLKKGETEKKRETGVVWNNPFHSFAGS